LVKDGTKIIARTEATSLPLHMKTGGVVPEVAARKQVEYIVPVIKKCLEDSGFTKDRIDAIAVTVGPGLVGSLVVGVESAKALSLAWDRPLIPINHLTGHIYANFIGKKPEDIEFPAAVLIVSGGHTDLILMKGHGDFDYLGGTLDDAAGEAFDKVARTLGLSSYMGGPAISKAASRWRPVKTEPMFKRPMLGSGDFNFSFSGIKTAVLYKVNGFKNAGVGVPVNEVAYEFEEAVTDVLVFKTVRAAKKFGVKSLLIAGGVSANKTLRRKLEELAADEKFQLHIPPTELCSDNAVYIASCAFFNYYPARYAEVSADPSLTVMSKPSRV
ncbi:tRNA (adenosine(37)-N6)-threonylcarbamoyltransferase complex transferase subunit TsaD, partial [candidate division WWE3 bacterium]|nr:tRNA (adenosine(37)-N6)-threonylcarbamoyltransferase complex transferase subunit TsaD [candidate division WWE3 bacterium]